MPITDSVWHRELGCWTMRLLRDRHQGRPAPPARRMRHPRFHVSERKRDPRGPQSADWPAVASGPGFAGLSQKKARAHRGSFRWRSRAEDRACGAPNSADHRVDCAPPTWAADLGGGLIWRAPRKVRAGKMTVTGFLDGRGRGDERGLTTGLAHPSLEEGGRPRTRVRRLDTSDINPDDRGARPTG